MSVSTAASMPNEALLWYRRVVLTGVVCNIALGVVGITTPTTLLNLLGLDPATPLIWPRFAAFLLILLSGFYVIAARDPVDNRFAAIFTISCRFGGVAFFSIIGGRYIIFGLFDLCFGLPQAIALYLGLTP